MILTCFKILLLGDSIWARFISHPAAASTRFLSLLHFPAVHTLHFYFAPEFAQLIEREDPWLALFATPASLLRFLHLFKAASYRIASGNFTK